MTQPDLFTYISPFGTEPFKLVRTNDPGTSHAAAEALDSTRLEGLVWLTIKSFGAAGCISDQVRAALPDIKSYSSVTARYKALAEGGHIVFTGEKRKGLSGRSQRVMVAV